MTDIVERLRNRALALKSVSRQTVTTKYDAALSDEASEEIERLRSELSTAYDRGAEAAGSFLMLKTGLVVEKIVDCEAAIRAAMEKAE